MPRSDTQTDRLTRTRHADRRMLLLLWTLDSVFLPIRCYKENDIIPVLIGQQEDRGRQRAAGYVGESLEEFEGTDEACLLIREEAEP